MRAWWCIVGQYAIVGLCFVLLALIVRVIGGLSSPWEAMVAVCFGFAFALAWWWFTK